MLDAVGPSEAEANAMPSDLELEQLGIVLPGPARESPSQLPREEGRHPAEPPPAPPQPPAEVSPPLLSPQPGHAAKRKAPAGEDRAALKARKYEGGEAPPDCPPGEAFASQFLREYVEGRRLLSPQVRRLAANARKWGLAHELPSGWYCIDDRVPRGQPSLADEMDEFEIETEKTAKCGWKVTGPQMKNVNPAVPVQIRYGNPKEGCARGYSAMRAAVYTWCTAKAEGGGFQEGEEVKLIHSYVGRASRNRNAPRRQGSRRASTGSTPRRPPRNSCPVPAFAEHSVAQHTNRFCSSSSASTIFCASPKCFASGERRRVPDGSRGVGGSSPQPRGGRQDAGTIRRHQQRRHGDGTQTLHRS